MHTVAILPRVRALLVVERFRMRSHGTAMIRTQQRIAVRGNGRRYGGIFHPRTTLCMLVRRVVESAVKDLRIAVDRVSVGKSHAIVEIAMLKATRIPRVPKATPMSRVFVRTRLPPSAMAP